VGEDGIRNCCLTEAVRVLTSDGWQEAWRPSSKLHPGAFSGQG